MCSLVGTMLFRGVSQPHSLHNHFKLKLERLQTLCILFRWNGFLLTFLFSHFFVVLLGCISAIIVQIDCRFHLCNCLRHFQSPTCLTVALFTLTGIHSFLCQNGNLQICIFHFIKKQLVLKALLATGNNYRIGLANCVRQIVRMLCKKT